MGQKAQITERPSMISGRFPSHGVLVSPRRLRSEGLTKSAFGVRELIYYLGSSMRETP